MKKWVSVPGARSHGVRGIGLGGKTLEDFFDPDPGGVKTPRNFADPDPGGVKTPAQKRNPDPGPRPRRGNPVFTPFDPVCLWSSNSDVLEMYKCTLG